MFLNSNMNVTSLVLHDLPKMDWKAFFVEFDANKGAFLIFFLIRVTEICRVRDVEPDQSSLTACC